MNHSCLQELGEYVIWASFANNVCCDCDACLQCKCKCGWQGTGGRQAQQQGSVAAATASCGAFKASLFKTSYGCTEH